MNAPNQIAAWMKAHGLKGDLSDRKQTHTVDTAVGKEQHHEVQPTTQEKKNSFNDKLREEQRRQARERQEQERVTRQKILASANDSGHTPTTESINAALQKHHHEIARSCWYLQHIVKQTGAFNLLTHMSTIFTEWQDNPARYDEEIDKFTKITEPVSPNSRFDTLLDFHFPPGKNVEKSQDKQDKTVQESYPRKNTAVLAVRKRKQSTDDDDDEVLEIQPPPKKARVQSQPPKLIVNIKKPRTPKSNTAASESVRRSSRLRGKSVPPSYGHQVSESNKAQEGDDSYISDGSVLSDGSRDSDGDILDGVDDL